MSDLEKLFEHAPEGATELVIVSGEGIAWAINAGIWSYDRDGWEHRSDRWQTIATRPQPRKTVEDAVEYFKEWPGGLDSVCIWDDSLGDYLFWVEYYTPVSDCYEVCNYEQFEACVAAKAKSKPEWEYIDAFGNPCSLLIDAPDSMGNVVILRQDGWYSPVARSSLKPIKPTISRAAKEQLEFYVQYRVDKYGDHAMKSDLIDYLAKHEVVK